MTSLRDQEKLAGDIRPVILNVCNFSKPAAGEPALLSFDDARTLFHEFGHALHGLLSNVTYPLLAGTSVSSDFVELPSQLYEHWLEVPEILQKYARHAHTGEPMPKALLDRLLATRTFNQGFATVEYTACALVDLDLHALPEPAALEVGDFERARLDALQMPAEIVMRHRLPHFQHLFSGGGYAAAYYSYMWSEVLDADAFEAFEETGNAFDPGDRQAPARLHLQRRQSARSGGGLQSLPRPATGGRCAAEKARPRHGAGACHAVSGCYRCGDGRDPRSNPTIFPTGASPATGGTCAIAPSAALAISAPIRRSAIARAC